MCGILGPAFQGLFDARMLVIPCSTDTLAAIAHGLASTRWSAPPMSRSGGRRLVLVPREMPLSAIHLENMLTLARLGVRVVPPMPAFYLMPKTVDEIVEALVERILQALGF
jgi:4-hydroxy-3-polyprenylbenzoate decarboxylase